MSDLSEISNAIASMTGDVEKLQANFDRKFESLAEFAARITSLEQKAANPPLERGGMLGGFGGSAFDTFGERFTKGFDLEAFKRGGKLRVDVGSLWTKNTITTSDIATRQAAELAPVALVPTRVRELIRVLPGVGTSVDYSRLLLFTNNAAVVAEGALKPESGMTFEAKNAAFLTIAHWIRATRQALGDTAQLRNLVDTLLLYGLNLRVENFLLNDPTDGLNTLAPAVASPSGTAVDRIRVAIGQVESLGWRVSGIVLNAADWQQIEAAKDSTGAYLLPGAPQSAVAPSLWSKPVIASAMQPQGTALVGAFDVGATIFDREDASVLASDSDRDNFVTNQITLLAETRLALCVQVVGAFRTTALPVIPA